MGSAGKTQLHLFYSFLNSM